MSLKEQIFYQIAPLTPQQKAKKYVSDMKDKEAFRLWSRAAYGLENVDDICDKFGLDVDTFKTELQGKAVEYGKLRM